MVELTNDDKEKESVPFAEAMRRFKECRDILGEEVYRAILEQCNVKKANDFLATDKRRYMDGCYQWLRAAVWKKRELEMAGETAGGAR
ncbi:hypothetical protein CCP2SC5_2460003 [Azospirillaceae bacterium]